MKASESHGDKRDRATSRPDLRCDVGLFPAYGLMYGSPLGCLCSEYINGYSALSSAPLDEPIDDSQRLVRGAAFDRTRRAKATIRPAEWPMHMADDESYLRLEGSRKVENTRRTDSRRQGIAQVYGPHRRENHRRIRPD